VLGWNFGDGHLNGEQLLRAIQPQCGFAAGDVRVVSVESQPLFDATMHWRVIDAVDGVIAEGRTRLADYDAVQAVSERSVRRGTDARTTCDGVAPGSKTLGSAPRRRRRIARRPIRQTRVDPAPRNPH
jgi:hypothetical protein